MKRLIPYIEHTLGISLKLNPFQKKERGKLPIFLKEAYRWHNIELANRNAILAEVKEENGFSIAQMETHFNQMQNKFNLPVIALFNQLEAFNRKRLIEKKIAFIVPDKQLYIPAFLIDLKEYGAANKKEQEKLTPIAQLLVLFHLLHRQENKQAEFKTFKELAHLLETNPMGITRAVDNLQYLDLVEVKGGKEKHIEFKLERKKLWQDLIKRNLLITPVLKRVFVDEKPKGVRLLQSNTTALPEYSNMNPSTQEFYAIEKNNFYKLQKNNALVNANKHEGQFCLEVWKYNPLVLDIENKHQNLVDPLSLYISLKDTNDERIQMALDDIINTAIW